MKTEYYRTSNYGVRKIYRDIGMIKLDRVEIVGIGGKMERRKNKIMKGKYKGDTYGK